MRQSIKNILSALAVVVFGFVLLNIAFIFDFLLQSLVRRLLGSVYPFVLHILFMFLICLISLFIFKSKLGVLFKAIYMTVPLAVIYLTIGIFFYRWLLLPYLFGGLFFTCVLYYFYRTKQPWLYYYTLILMTVVMLLVGILGVEI